MKSKTTIALLVGLASVLAAFLVTSQPVSSIILGGSSSNPIWITPVSSTTNLESTIRGQTNGNYLEPINGNMPVVGTNQTSFSTTTYSLGNNITSAGVVTNAAFATTNAAFHVAGGSGFLTDIEITSSTNRDYVIWIYPKLITAPTIGNAFLPTRTEMRGRKGPYATTNLTYCSEWQIEGTNFTKRINIGCAVNNLDSSQNLMIVGTYLDTKADVAANAIQVEVGLLNDK